MKKIAIIGACGYVGRGLVDLFKDRYDLFLVDPLADKLGVDTERQFKDVSELPLDIDLAIISVPTNTDPETGANDMSIVEDIVRCIPCGRILIKSTLRIGTVDRLISETKKQIAMSPEYLGEGKYYDSTGFSKSMAACPFMICGGKEDIVNYIFDIFVPVLGPNKVYHRTTAVEAEIIKLMENTYFGVKNIFAQTMYDICQKFNADWYRVREGWALDPRVDKLHTAIFPDNRGVSGKCLPKDLNTLVQDSIDVGYDPELFKTMLKVNSKLREDEPIRFKE